MNCEAVQNQILGLPDPRELPPALRAHVLTCRACRAWVRQAARLEALLERLPVPPAPGEKKEVLLGDLMAVEPVIRPMPVPATRPGFAAAAARFVGRNATYAGGLAAAVLVAVGVVGLWPRATVPPGASRPPQHDPLVEKLARGNVALARADTTARKLEVLNRMADDIAADARGMANIAPGAELQKMAGRYEAVVKSGLVPRAKELQAQPLALAPAEKAKLLDALAAKLGADAGAAEKLAGEAKQDAQPALKRMAEAAREGESSLRAAAREGK
jgi:hypothetical protein